MAITFQFYHDSALTQPVTSGNPITATQDTTNTLAAVDKQLWFGSTTSSVKARATSSPGVAQISVSIADANAGTGEPATAIKLASAQAGLTAATAGAALNIGTQVLSGSANAVTFWARIDDATATAGSYTDLSLVTNTLDEDPV
jgi:hypothetical protein